MANFSIADGGAELDDEFGRGGQDELDGLVRGGVVAEIDGEFGRQAGARAKLLSSLWSKPVTSAERLQVNLVSEVPSQLGEELQYHPF